MDNSQTGKAAQNKKQSRKTASNLRQVAGRAAFVADIDTNNSQTLVKVSKGGKHWLSPTGWTEDEKSTLLDSYCEDGTTLFTIPEIFAIAIEHGEAVSFICDSLDLKGNVQWSSPEKDAAPQSEAKTETPQKTSFFDKMRGANAAKPDPVVDSFVGLPGLATCTGTNRIAVEFFVEAAALLFGELVEGIVANCRGEIVEIGPGHIPKSFCQTHKITSHLAARPLVVAPILGRLIHRQGLKIDIFGFFGGLWFELGFRLRGRRWRRGHAPCEP